MSQRNEIVCSSAQPPAFGLATGRLTGIILPAKERQQQSKAATGLRRSTLHDPICLHRLPSSEAVERRRRQQSEGQPNWVLSFRASCGYRQTGRKCATFASRLFLFVGSLALLSSIAVAPILIVLALLCATAIALLYTTAVARL